MNLAKSSNNAPGRNSRCLKALATPQLRNYSPVVFFAHGDCFQRVADDQGRNDRELPKRLGRWKYWMFQGNHEYIVLRSCLELFLLIDMLTCRKRTASFQDSPISRCEAEKAHMQWTNQYVHGVAKINWQTDWPMRLCNSLIGLYNFSIGHLNVWILYICNL